MPRGGARLNAGRPKGARDRFPRQRHEPDPGREVRRAEEIELAKDRAALADGREQARAIFRAAAPELARDAITDYRKSRDPRLRHQIRQDVIDRVIGRPQSIAIDTGGLDFEVIIGRLEFNRIEVVNGKATLVEAQERLIEAGDSEP